MLVSAGRCGPRPSCATRWPASIRLPLKPSKRLVSLIRVGVPLPSQAASSYVGESALQDPGRLDPVESAAITAYLEWGGRIAGHRNRRGRVTQEAAATVVAFAA